MVARGRLPETPLPAVQAFVDNRRFGCLPRAGGSFDQDARLMRELHEVAAIVEKVEAEKAKQETGDKQKRPRARARPRRKSR